MPRQKTKGNGEDMRQINVVPKLGKGLTPFELVVYTQVFLTCTLPHASRQLLLKAILEESVTTLVQATSLTEPFSPKNKSESGQKPDYRLSVSRMWEMPELFELTEEGWILYVQALAVYSSPTLIVVDSFITVGGWWSAWVKFWSRTGSPEDKR
jgi:hypothetical protein